VIITDEEANHLKNGRSMDSIQSSYTNGSSSPGLCTESDITPDEQEEKARLISQVLELQNTLDGKQAKIKILQIFNRFALFNLDLSQRVDTVKEENLKLRSENQVLGQYIENLMSASSVFQSTSPNSVKKK
jgi:short coiled-coil protein